MNTKLSFTGKFLTSLLVLVFVLGGGTAYSNDGNGNCTCSGCGDCTNAVNDNSCTVVKLNGSITNHSGTCIDYHANFNNKIFDCQGYVMDGDDSSWDHGIRLTQRSNNTIKNCIITDLVMFHMN